MSRTAPTTHAVAMDRDHHAPRILTVVDYYMPGYRAGGPIRAVQNLSARLSEEFNFHILTRNRDLGQREAYGNVPPDRWLAADELKVLYASPAGMRTRALERVVNATNHDLLYLNSFFSRFTIRLLLSRRFGRIPKTPVVLAPRGEMARTALAHSSSKKRLHLFLSRLADLYADLTWQASSAHEADDIHAFLNTNGVPYECVTVARELPAVINAGSERRQRPKQPGVLNAVFVSRVSRIKNLDGALRVLRGVKGRVHLAIYGPVEDARYWRECSQDFDKMPDNVTVKYCGELQPNHVPAVLSNSDVLFLPTHGENFGHVIAEALGAGCPVLIGDQTPWHGLERAQAGWELPAQDEQGFRDRIEMLVQVDEPMHARLRAGAREYVGAVASAQEIVAENSELFWTALRRTRR